MMDDSNITRMNTLEELEYEMFKEKGIPAVIFVSILSIVGVIGNTHTLIVYGFSPEMKKVSVRIFILWLAAADLIVSLFNMPFELFDLRYDYTFSVPAACKLFRYIGQAASFTSVGFLTAIAIERYAITSNSARYTDKPASWYNKISCIMITIFFSLTSPALVVYGANQKEIPGYANLTGSDCATLEEYKTAEVFITYGILVISFTFICFSAMTFLYAKILFTILSQIRNERKRKTKHPPSSSESFNETNNTDKITSGYDKARQLTISLMIAAAVSYLGYLVFIITNIVGFANPRFAKKVDGPVTAVLLRCLFLNNAVNPVVYFAMDACYRSECISFYQRCMKHREEISSFEESSLNTLSTRDETSI